MNESTADRPVPLRRRPDLLVCTVETRRGGRSWRVKDPVSAEYFELNEHEQAVLSLLDGKSSMREIANRFADRFAPHRLSPSVLQGFLARLKETGLVVGVGTIESAGKPRAAIRGVESLASRILSLASIRLPGINPQWFLDVSYPCVRWLFRTQFVVMVVASNLILLALAAVEFDGIRARIPGWHEVFTPGRLAFLWITVAASRLIHELAHAYCCRHFGGRCPELGLLLLCGAPCLYCDVSDAWMMPQRRARIAVSVAGIVAELAIAAAAGFVWWCSEPGVVRWGSLALAATCSINTLLINGNPLLRYDGYYALIDLVEEPHLAEDAAAFWRESWLQWGLGQEISHPTRGVNLPTWCLALYGLAAGVYRCFVMGGILWFAHAGLSSLGFPDLGRLVVAIGFSAWLLIPLSRWAAAFRDPIWRRRIHRSTAVRSFLLLALLLAFLVFVPLPRRISAEAILEAPDAPRVYVTVEGRLQRSVEVGARVEKGDLIARLTNPKLEQELERLASEHRLAELKLRRLEIARASDPSAAALIPAVREIEQSLRRKLAQKRTDHDQLSIHAPVAGEVLPPAPRPVPSGSKWTPGTWRHEPLADFNAGCWLESGTWLCQIGDKNSLQPTLLLEQHDVDLVRPGQAVRLRFVARPSEILNGVVSQVGVEPAAPAAAAHEAAVATGLSDPAPSSTRPRFACRVAFSARENAGLLRDSGTARISVAPATVAERCWRWMRRTFRFGTK